jgi:hypothetical protein
VFALDKSKPKIEKILRNVQNLKLTCIKPFLWDATKAVGEIGDSEDVQGARNIRLPQRNYGYCYITSWSLPDECRKEMRCVIDYIILKF